VRPTRTNTLRGDVGICWFEREESRLESLHEWNTERAAGRTVELAVEVGGGGEGEVSSRKGSRCGQAGTNVMNFILTG